MTGVMFEYVLDFNLSCKPNRLDNRRQQRNGPIIHDVTSVKYNKEDKISSH